MSERRKSTSKRGGIPNNRIEPAVLARAMALIGAHYADFGPTLAAQKLSGQHAISLSVETMRPQMMAEGLWQPKKGSKISGHPMRCRSAHLGEMIQIDGSPASTPPSRRLDADCLPLAHDWLEGRSAPYTLLVLIDDATSKLMQLRFMPAETTLGYTCVCCTTTSWRTVCRWHCIATNTASSASTPVTRRPMPRPNSDGTTSHLTNPALDAGLVIGYRGRHGSWASNRSTPTARRPRGAWSAPIKLCRTGWSKKCDWPASATWTAPMLAGAGALHR